LVERAATYDVNGGNRRSAGCLVLPRPFRAPLPVWGKLAWYIYTLGGSLTLLSRKDDDICLSGNLVYFIHCHTPTLLQVDSSFTSFLS